MVTEVQGYRNIKGTLLQSYRNIKAHGYRGTRL